MPNFVSQLSKNRTQCFEAKKFRLSLETARIYHGGYPGIRFWGGLLLLYGMVWYGMPPV